MATNCYIFKLMTDIHKQLKYLNGQNGIKKKMRVGGEGASQRLEAVKWYSSKEKWMFW